MLKCLLLLLITCAYDLLPPVAFALSKSCLDPCLRVTAMAAGDTDLSDAPPFDQYIAAIYFAMTSIATVGWAFDTGLHLLLHAKYLSQPCTTRPWYISKLMVYPIVISNAQSSKFSKNPPLAMCRLVSTMSMCSRHSPHLGCFRYCVLKHLSEAYT